MQWKFSAIMFTLSLFCLSSCGWISPELSQVTLSKMAYSHSRQYPNEVYIQEDGEYTPYLVFNANYDSGILLLRKELTKEKVMFTDTNVFNAEGNYYPKSDVDSYLNNEYINKLSVAVQNAIEDSNVEVTALSTISRDHFTRKTETIQRKVFLLSATEIGVKNGMAAVEGKKIGGLEKFNASGSQWLRTAYLWDDVHAWACGEGSTGQEPLRSKLQLRPAFTLSPDLVVLEKTDIIPEASVFVLEIDSE